VVKRKKGGGWFSWLTGGDDDDLDVDLEPEQTSECTLSLLTSLTYLKQEWYDINDQAKKKVQLFQIIAQAIFLSQTSLLLRSSLSILFLLKILCKHVVMYDGKILCASVFNKCICSMVRPTVWGREGWAVQGDRLRSERKHQEITGGKSSVIVSQFIYFYDHSGGSVVRAFAPWMPGRGFDPRPRHTKDVIKMVPDASMLRAQHIMIGLASLPSQTLLKMSGFHLEWVVESD